jgi:anti-sigma regulatory factor (Ser/Thr protein kinase)
MSDRVCAGPGVTEVGTDGPADCTETLPRVPESARDARLLVCRALDAWGLSALRDSAVLVMSELVANAVDHACGPVVRLSVARTAERRVRVTVADMDRRPPRAGNADPLDERGRGLLLVAAVSQRWGVERSPSGKQVWADLAAP